MLHVLGPLQPSADIIQRVFKSPGVGRILLHGYRFHRCAWCGCAGLLVVELPMDQGVPRCSPLDLPEADEITPLEITIAMLELPERRFGISSMEDVAHCSEG